MLLPAWRIFKFSFWLLWFLIPLMIKNAILGYDLERSLKVRRKFARNGAKSVGIRMEVEGTPPDYPGMFISNHQSYLDPIIQLCQILALPIAKAEVAKWPLVGIGAKNTGIVFVKRDSNSSRKNTLQAIASIVNGGNQALVYPEGTTVGGTKSGRFSRGGFKLAAQNGFEVFPIAIIYKDNEVPWVGKIPFATHAKGVFSKKRIDVKVRYGPAMYNPNADELLEQTQAWIDKALLELRGEWEEQV